MKTVRLQKTKKHNKCNIKNNNKNSQKIQKKTAEEREIPKIWKHTIITPLLKEGKTQKMIGASSSSNKYTAKYLRGWQIRD